MNKYSYKGQVITANSKQEAIKQIVADSKKPKVDMKIVNKWMKKNLNLTDAGLGKDHWKNPKTGDVYYTFEAAKRLAKKVPGYHLPTAKEWNKLAEACGGVCENPEEKNPGYKNYDNIQELKKRLKIKLCGYYNYGNFYSVGSIACFWSSSESGASDYYKYFDNDASMSSSMYSCTRGCSVRLVKK